jgi:ABC-2 type transport system permease protein
MNQKQHISKQSFLQTNPFFKVLFREFERMTSSTIYLFSTLVGPLVAFIVLLSVFSSGVPRNIPAGIVDLDNTNLSRKIGMWINATPETEIIGHYTDASLAYQRMKEGKLDAVIVIPEGTERNILKGQSETVRVFINNTNILKGGYLQKGIYKALATLSAGIKLQVALKSGMSQDQALARIQPVRLQQHVLFNPFGNYSYFLLSALLPLMIIVFTLLSGVFAVGLEVKEGTGPDWLEHANGSLIVALSGKLAPYTFLLFIDSMVMNAILFVQMGTPLAGSFAFLLVSELFLMMTYQMLAVFLVAATANLRLALSLASAYSMMALTFSGLTFPQFGMPLAARLFSYIFPFTQWIKIFISQAMRGEAIAHALVPLALFLPFILLTVIFLPRLKRLLKEEKFWGKI